MPRFLRRHRGACLLIAGTALLRGAFLWATRDDAVFRVPYLDGAFYQSWARSLAAGHGDFQGPYFLPPLYPQAMSWLYRWFGPDPLAVRIAQSVLGVLDTALVLGLGRLLFGPAAGFAAAALFALEGCLVFHEGLLGLEPLLLALLLGGFAALVLPRSALVCGAASGLLLGLGTLARATALMAAPVAAAVLAGRRSPPSTKLRAPGERRPWRPLAVCAAMWLLVLLPVLVRNHREGAGLVLTTNAGINFYAGNGPGANGRFRQPPGVQFFTAPLADAAAEGARLPTAIAPRPLTVAAVAGTREAADSALWFGRSRAWIGAHPGAFAGLLLRKAGLVLQAREIPQIESFEFHRARLPLLRIFFVDPSWILPLAALGIWQAWRERRPHRGALLGFALAALLPCVLFFVTARHRLPALPYLCLFAGAGVAALGGWIAARRWTYVVVALPLLAVGVACTRVGAKPPRTLPGWQHAQMAERLYALGDLGGAIRAQEQAAAWLPERPEVQVNLAVYWSERGAAGDLERAEKLLRGFLSRAPDQPLVLYHLGVILEQLGRPDEAAAAWRRTLQLDPNFAPARERLRLLAP